MANIFLTGSTGFIGSHVLGSLKAQGHRVETDMRELRFNKWDVIIHLAAVTHIKKEFDGKLFDANIVLSEQIFSNPARIIYASSCSAKYSTNPYAYTKQYCEYLGEIHGGALGLRFHNVYGPGNQKGIVWYLGECKDGDKITIRGPELVRDYVYVEDVVQCIVSHLRPLSIYKFTGVEDVGTGVGTTTLDLVNLYQKLSGKKFELSFMPAGDNEPASMISNDSRYGVTTLEEGLNKTIRLSNIQYVNYDHIKQNR